MKIKGFFSKIICMALATATVMSFSVIPSFAAEVNNNMPASEKEFVPSGDFTWGELYRYFDPEGFAALSEKEKQFYNSTPLNSTNADSESADTSSTNQALERIKGSGKEAYVSTSGIIAPIEEQNRAIELGITDLIILLAIQLFY